MLCVSYTIGESSYSREREGLITHGDKLKERTRRYRQVGIFILRARMTHALGAVRIIRIRAHCDAKHAAF